MDYETTQPESTATSISQAASSSSNQAQSTDRALRSSTRIKAAKEKDKEESVAENSAQRRVRDQTSKGKAKETNSDAVPTRSSKRAKRATLPPTATALIINEPVKDPKGKKRAIAHTPSDEEAPSPSSSKRIRSSNSYTLRNRKDSQSQMPKKKSSPKKNTPLRGKGPSLPGPSHHSDEEMMDVDYGGAVRDDHDSQNDDGDEIDQEETNEKVITESSADRMDAAAALAAAGNDARHSFEETMSMFDLGRLGGYASQITSRLRTLLNNIKPTADPSTRLISLQELSELLSISTEDTLAGSFQVESFVRELVRILGGSGGEAQEDRDEDDENDEEAALAAAIAMSAGGVAAGDENLEAQLLACRCLANLMEALPGCGHTLVYHGAIPVLCSKLLEISYIDLAEQTLITLEKISEEYPSAIVREGGLAALLNYLDFFSIAVQRTALQAAANCCRNASPDSFQMIKDVWPIIRNCLGYADQRLVDYASLCVIRVIESYHRSHFDKLEILVDADLIRAINMLLLPSGGSSLVPPGTFTLLIRSLATAARASPNIAIALLQADIVTTLHQILTGVLPSNHDESEDQGDSATGQGLGGGLADMTVMQNLAHRPKDQVEEALTLISELLPPLPKDGVFDHRGYSEKALHKMVKAKAKAERAARSAAIISQANLIGGASPGSSRAHSPTGAFTTSADDEATAPLVAHPEFIGNGETLPTIGVPNVPKETAVDRATLLQANLTVVNRFIRLITPVLVDVYSASVSIPIRIKSLASILKAICFQEEDQLRKTFKNIPIASFASSILSSKDHPNLMIGVLQMVELLLSKAPSDYRASFRREGVLHEIEALASRPLPPKSKEKDKEKEQGKDAEAGEPQDVSIPGPPGASSSRRPHLLDPEDAYTLRARVIRFKYLSNDSHTEGDATFGRLRRLVDTLKQTSSTEEELRDALHEMADLFSSPRSTVSSFELLQSGLVDALLEFTTVKRTNIDVTSRQTLLLQELSTVMDLKSTSVKIGTPFAVLVKKLQESLTRMESLEVTTVSPGLEDSKRNAPSLLARQIRLRLVAEDHSDTPRTCNNIVVSIHAIATFQALNDYLRPRLSGLLSSLGGSRFSGMLAALAAGRISAGALAGALADATGSTHSNAPDTSSSGNSASTEGSAKPERRRSQRLSAKASSTSLSDKNRVLATGVPGVGLVPPLSTASTSSAPASSIAQATEGPLTEVAKSETVVNDDDEDDADFMEADVDAEVIEDDLDQDELGGEKTVNLSVADDGSKVEAQTPDGTRVATPTPPRDQSSLGTSTSATDRPSYAAALKNKTSDWYLEFSMDDNVLPLDMTIYGAVHQHESRKANNAPVSSGLIWQGVYTVKYKKMSGPRPATEGRPEGSELVARAKSPAPMLTTLSEDAPYAKILRLLRVLHKLNARATVDNESQCLQESAFINNKLTAKLTRQLEEPLIVASSCLPDWAMDLPLHFPFLFPFSTRYSFLQSTAFGYARLILKWQSQQNRTQENSRRDDAFAFLGRLQRQKVRISRKHILESAFKVFELYGSSSSILEVEYFDEVGTGLGPTLEFYSLVSKEFARRDLKIWRDADASYPGIYVHHPLGLFPAPSEPQNEGNEKCMFVFRIVGQFVAKAMLDSRIIDMSFNKTFLRLILNEEVPLTISTLKHVDPSLANSLSKLRTLAYGPGVSAVEDLMLDFTLPGYDIELKPGGKDIPVTAANLEEYINEVISVTLGRGIESQIRAFREGFSKVFPVTDLQAFSADELSLLFGNGEEDWTNETLLEAIKADHGFNIESPAIRDLVAIMKDYDGPSRRSFLQFITGSPKLPIGGFRGLNPPLTVVRKPHEPPLTADDYLPSVMTCVNYLKLPQYSTRAVMKEKLGMAMYEGVGSFHLS